MVFLNILNSNLQSSNLWRLWVTHFAHFFVWLFYSLTSSFRRRQAPLSAAVEVEFSKLWLIGEQILNFHSSGGQIVWGIETCCAGPAPRPDTVTSKIKSVDTGCSSRQIIVFSEATWSWWTRSVHWSPQHWRFFKVFFLYFPFFSVFLTCSVSYFARGNRLR